MWILVARALHLRAVVESTAPHLVLGFEGELLACRALERDGYAIVATRYRTRVGEIDIVAMDGRVLVFVEVKTRHDRRCGSPFEQITARKRGKIVAMAQDYLARHRTDAVACRFDVVGVTMGEGPPKVEILKNAFDAA